METLTIDIQITNRYYWIIKGNTSQEKSEENFMFHRIMTLQFKSVEIKITITLIIKRFCTIDSMITLKMSMNII